MKDKNLFCVGHSVQRKDARSKVLGEALYIDDYGYEGMLYASAVRSPRPRIKILNISDAGAKKIKGFVTLVTAKDVPGENLWPLVINDYPFFPEKEAKFAGQTIALAVAQTPEAALAAAGAVRVDFKELPFIDDPLESIGTPGNPGKIFGKDNVFSSYVIKKGDAQNALKEADVTVEGIFTTNYQVHGYIEPQGVIAFPQGRGGMTVYGAMQCPFYVHEAVSQGLGVSHNKVRIVQRVTGGAFGGKEDVPGLLASHAAIAARKTGRPVKLIYGRKEDFLSMSKRHPSWTKISYGAKKDGTLIACRVKYVLDSGAYATLSPIVLWRGTVHAAGPYRIPDVFIESYAVATNKVPCGAFRGFGQPQVCFANESLIDELAIKLRMDPLEFRIKNALREGDSTATGQVIKGSCGLLEALEKIRTASRTIFQKSDTPRTAADFGTKTAGAIRKGIGVSANFYGVGLGARGQFLDRAGAQVNIQKDGSVQVFVGNTEMGQGAQTVLSQICAESLNAPYDLIEVEEVDTQMVPDSGPTVASRTTLMSGNAIVNACQPLRERIFSVARDMLSKAPDSSDMLAFEGEFKMGANSATFSEVIKECWQRKLKMAEQGWYSAPHTSFEMKDGQGEPYSTYAYSVNAAEVEVDIQTGEVRVSRVTSAHDLGKAVNPMTAEGQVEGGVLQGLGYALCENLVYKDGIMVNPGFTDYVLPSTAEVPQFKTFIIEHPYSDGPYAAKGFGETPLIGVAPAVANAIRKAAGVRINSLPMLPEKIWIKIRGSGLATK